MSAKSPTRPSSDLLSRKGMASPSAGPESRANMVRVLGTRAPDLTVAPPPGRAEPAPSRSKLADWIAPEQASRKRVRVSLRLDEDRHARLKLVSTQRDCTLQSIFTQALDEYFDRHAPDLQDLTARLRGRARAKPANSARKSKSRAKRTTEDRNGPPRS